MQQQQQPNAAAKALLAKLQERLEKQREEDKARAGDVNDQDFENEYEKAAVDADEDAELTRMASFLTLADASQESHKNVLDRWAAETRKVQQETRQQLKDKAVVTVQRPVNEAGWRQLLVRRWGRALIDLLPALVEKPHSKQFTALLDRSEDFESHAFERLYRWLEDCEDKLVKHFRTFVWVDPNIDEHLGTRSFGNFVAIGVGLDYAVGLVQDDNSDRWFLYCLPITSEKELCANHTAQLEHRTRLETPSGKRTGVQAYRRCSSVPLVRPEMCEVHGHYVSLFIENYAAGSGGTVLAAKDTLLLYRLPHLHAKPDWSFTFDPKTVNAYDFVFPVLAVALNIRASHELAWLNEEERTELKRCQAEPVASTPAVDVILVYNVQNGRVIQSFVCSGVVDCLSMLRQTSPLEQLFYNDDPKKLSVTWFENLLGGSKKRVATRMIDLQAHLTSALPADIDPWRTEADELKLKQDTNQVFKSAPSEEAGAVYSFLGGHRAVISRNNSTVMLEPCEQRPVPSMHHFRDDQVLDRYVHGNLSVALFLDYHLELASTLAATPEYNMRTVTRIDLAKELSDHGDRSRAKSEFFRRTRIYKAIWMSNESLIVQYPNGIVVNYRVMADVQIDKFFNRQQLLEKMGREKQFIKETVQNNVTQAVAESKAADVAAAAAPAGQ